MVTLEYRTRYAKEAIAVNQQGSSSMRVGSEGIVEIKETATFTHEGKMVNIEVEGIDKNLNTVRAFINLPVDMRYIVADDS